jgi:hypothetical protein
MPILLLTIRLINYTFKINIKLLADRLGLFMDFLIDQSQMIYIKDRLIMDNVVRANEILHQVKLSKTQEVFF